MSDSILRSERGIPVAWSTRQDFDQNVITVELSLKWHGIQVVYPRQKRFDHDVVTIVEWNFPGWTGLEHRPAYVDHVPNPHCVEEFARLNRYAIDELALELIHGRWLVKVGNEF